MTRRELREHCFKMLFSADFYPTREEAKAQLGQYLESPEEDGEDSQGVLQILHKVDVDPESGAYLEERTAAIMDRIPDLDSQIDQVAAGWKTRRMGKVELTILRLALYEMKYDSAVPVKVAVNEAVELAKKFGGKDSPSFVNGILAKFLPEETPSEKEAQDPAADAPPQEGKVREQEGQP